MAIVATQRAQAMPREVAARPQLSSRDHLITVLLAAWMTAGIFIDGWAHINLTSLETFFTPWHAVFYSGFLATAGWIVYQTLCFQPRPRSFARFAPDAVTAGYLVGFFGILLFGLGGVADMLWHTVFGIEVGIDALLSPSHIALFTGGLLIGTSPLRALWRVDGQPSSFAPILGSLTLTTAGIAFFFLYLSPFTDLTPTTSFVEWAKRAPAELGYADVNISLGVASFLLSTVILVTPLLIALLRFRLPFGSATLIFTTVAFGLVAMREFQPSAPLLGAFIGGLHSDVALGAAAAGTRPACGPVRRRGPAPGPAVDLPFRGSGGGLWDRLAGRAVDRGDRVERPGGLAHRLLAGAAATEDGPHLARQVDRQGNFGPTPAIGAFCTKAR